MSTDIGQSGNPYWQFVRRILQSVLPAEHREDHLNGLDEEQQRHPVTTLHGAASVASTVLWAYWTPIAAAFSRWGTLLTVVLVVVSYAKTDLMWQLAWPLGAVLAALSLRDARTRHDVRNNPKRQLDYYGASIGDAVLSLLFTAAGQGLAKLVSPWTALPAEILYRGVVVCVPLMFVLRMVLRPKPEFSAELADPEATAEDIYKRIRRLDTAWLLMYVLLIAQNVSDKHNYSPDTLRGLTIVLFAIWRSLQADPFTNRIGLVSALTDIGKMLREEMVRKLPRGLDDGEVLYLPYIVVENVIRLTAGMSVLEGLWPWLSGRTSHIDIARAGGSFVAFAIVMLTWEYMKKANRVAAKAIFAAKYLNAEEKEKEEAKAAAREEGTLP